MTKRVDQGLSANSVNLMLGLWWQRFLPASDSDAKVNVGLYIEFLLNAGQSKNQV
jgi:hypothetical protein